MLQKLKRLGSYLIIIVLLPYVITVFMNGQAVPASKTVDTMQVKAERDGKEMDVPLEDYCIGRMAKEIPVSYEKEALRAQAVLVRTTVSGSYDRSSGSSQHGDYQKKEKIKVIIPDWGIWYQKLQRLTAGKWAERLRIYRNMEYSYLWK